MTAADLRARLERLREQHQLGLSGGLFMSTPQFRDAIFREMGMRPGDKIGMLAVRGDGLGKITPIPPHAPEDEAARGRLELMEIWASVVALGIGQGLKEHDYFGSPPLFEFARHVRNAVAHGATFDIRHERGPAVCGTKVITKALDGTPLFDFMTPNDIISMLDDVIAELHTRETPNNA